MKIFNKTLAFAAICIVFAAAVTTASAQRTWLSGSGLKSVVKDKGVLSANPAVNIDQCSNGGVGQTPVPCANSAWQNGNLNGNQAHYVEGDSVPYRNVFTNLVVGGTYTITIQYDTTKGGKHALDYLTSYDRTETIADGNDPCSDVMTCGAPLTTPIPIDPNVTAGQDGNPATTGDNITQIPGDFTMWGVSNVSAGAAYTLTGTYAGDSSTSIDITFTATGTTAVLAWGGHIATRLNWGTNNSAINISGSPYHMRNLVFTGTGVIGGLGNQDRSLSADAVFYAPTITIIKVVSTFDNTGASSQSFGFTTNFAADASFSLVDDNNGPGIDTHVITLTDPIQASVAVQESLVTGWNFDHFSSCTVDPGGLNSAGTIQQDSATRTVSFGLLEGNIATCTFNNNQLTPTAADASISGRVSTQSGYGIRGAIVTVYNANTGASMSAITNSFGYYMLTGLKVQDLYVINVYSKSYTFSNGQWSGVLGGDLADINFTSDQ